MEIPILFEDDSVCVIDKPAGIVVNRAESVKEETIQDWVEKRMHLSNSNNSANLLNDFINRAGIVHRIDKETSGILLIAKTKESFIELQRQFKEHIIKKKYIAIVHGEVLPDLGEINAPVGRLPWNKERFGIVPGGKESKTAYKKIKDFVRDGEKFSLLELYPQTGRTHQIRVHLKYINHPILGDYLYAGRKVQRNDRVWAMRVMLHAFEIIFMHPVNGNAIEIKSPMPDDMNRIINP
jgi:23S rRNA pseudouridine1911/1915/1917 synthase